MCINFLLHFRSDSSHGAAAAGRNAPRPAGLPARPDQQRPRHPGQGRQQQQRQRRRDAALEGTADGKNSCIQHRLLTHGMRRCGACPPVVQSHGQEAHPGLLFPGVSFRLAVFLCQAARFGVRDLGGLAVIIIWRVWGLLLLLRGLGFIIIAFDSVLLLLFLCLLF